MLAENRDSISETSESTEVGGSIEIGAVGRKAVEDQEALLSGEDKKFELPGLKEAKVNNYPWAEKAESAQTFLSREILSTEKELQYLREGVKEEGPLHKAISEKAKAIFENRQVEGKKGTAESDFFAAIGETKKDNEFKLRTLNSRWDRLKTLSSSSDGVKDPELNERAYFKAEELRKKNEQVNDIKCNDGAREELLLELTREMPKEEVEQKRKEEEKVAELKNRMVKSFNEVLSQTQDNETGKIEINNKEKLNSSYKQARDIFKELAGEDLNNRVKTEAKMEAEKDGEKIFSKKEWFSLERIAKAERLGRIRKRKEAVQHAWNNLQPKKKAEFRGCWNIAPLDAGEKRMAFSQYLENKRKELSKKGFFLSRDAFCEGLTATTFNIQDIKVKGLFFKKALLSPGEKGKSKKEFSILSKKFANDFDENVREEANKKIEKMYEEGKDKLLRRKIKKATELVFTVAEFNDYKEALRKMGLKGKKDLAKKIEEIAGPSKENIDWEAEKNKIEKGYEEKIKEIRKTLVKARSRLMLGTAGEMPEEIREAAEKKEEQVREERASKIAALKGKKRLFDFFLGIRKPKTIEEIKEELNKI
ncbi:hypothetical protein KKC00_01750 [Patescibacteria group bacterium]|nr:hypothetical protein [Patescibacteria group bacterium]